jgi:hypothetical protein
MKNSGTRKVGIRLSGNAVIGCIEIPFGSIKPAVVPRPTATSRSAMPSACQSMKPERDEGFASFHAAAPLCSMPSI